MQCNQGRGDDRKGRATADRSHFAHIDCKRSGLLCDGSEHGQRPVILGQGMEQGEVGRYTVERRRKVTPALRLESLL